MNHDGPVELEFNGDSSHSRQETEVPAPVEEPENSANNSAAFDETWDLQSPLIPLTPSRNESTQEDPMSLELEQIRAPEDSEDDAFDPWKISLTMCAMMMSMLFFGLVTGSFFFPWSDTKFRLTMDTVNSFPFDFSVPLYTDAKFSDTLSIFKQSHSNTLVVLMIVSTIVAPSLWMLIQVFFIYFINRNPKKIGADVPGKRRLLRLKRFVSLPLFLTKFSMSIVYVNSMLLVATSNVRLAFGGDYSPDDQDSTKRNDGNGDYIYAEIENFTRGGLVAYVLGITFSTCAFMLFRHLMSYRNTSDTIQSTSSANETPAPPTDANGDKPFLSPPPMAFRMTPNYEDLGLSINESVEEDYRELSTPLMARMRNDESVEGESTNRDDEVDNAPEEEEVSPTSMKEEEKTSRWREILEFETGTLSFLMALPILNQPLIQLKYSGILTPVFDESPFESTSLTLMDIIGIITTKGGKGIFPFVTSSLLWINVILIPVSCWICCTVEWLLKTFSTRKHAGFTNLAKLCHPLSHMTPFVLSIFVSLASLDQVSNFLFSENSFCPILKGMKPVEIDSHCLQISASMQPALFLLLIQTIAADIFIYCVHV